MRHMADWTEPFTAVYRFMRVDHATMLETERLTNLEQSGSITRDSDTEIKERGRLTAHGVFDIGADYLRVYLDATGMYTGWKESRALGTFVPSVSSRDVDGPSSTSSVSLSGLLKVVDDDDFDAPVTLEQGANVLEYVTGLLEDMGLRVEADESNYALSSTWSFGVDSNESGKLSAINELLDIAGFYSAMTDEYGTVKLMRYVRPGDRKPIHSFVEGRNARFLKQVTDELDTSDVKNVMRAIYSTQEATVIGIAIDDDPSSKWSTVTLGRRIVGSQRYNDEVDQETADAKALELLVNSQSVIHRVTIQHTYVPGLGITDAVTADYPTGGVSGVFVTRTQDINLGVGCLVESEVKRSER